MKKIHVKKQNQTPIKTPKHTILKTNKQTKSEREREKTFEVPKGKNKHLTKRGKRIGTIAQTMQTRRQLDDIKRNNTVNP